MMISHNISDILSAEEQQRLEYACLRDRTGNALGIILSLYLGLRISEVCGLRWSDFNFSEETVHIQRKVERIQTSDSRSIKRTKLVLTDIGNESYNRIIPLPKKLIRFMPAPIPDKGYVLRGKSNEYVDPRTLQLLLHRILKDNNVRDINFNILRDTFTARCAERGMDILSLSEVLGHKSITVTLDKVKDYINTDMTAKRDILNSIHGSSISTDTMSGMNNH